MRNNRGISLIELIVVVSIIALMSGGTAIGIRLLSFRDMKIITKEVDQSLQKLRMDTMSQGKLYHYLFIEWDDIEQQYNIGYVTGTGELNESNWKDGRMHNSKKLASQEIKILLGERTDGSDLTELRNLKPVILIQYFVHSGAFQSSYRMICIERGTNRATIHLVGKTGRHYTS